MSYGVLNIKIDIKKESEFKLYTQFLKTKQKNQGLACRSSLKFTM